MISLFVDYPVKANKYYYTERRCFKSKKYSKEAQIAIVVLQEDANDVSLLLEPTGFSFAKTYKEQLYNSGLPAMVIGVKNINAEISLLKKRGIVFRDDLSRLW